MTLGLPCESDPCCCCSCSGRPDTPGRRTGPSEHPVAVMSSVPCSLGSTHPCVHPESSLSRLWKVLVQRACPFPGAACSRAPACLPTPASFMVECRSSSSWGACPPGHLGTFLQVLLLCMWASLLPTLSVLLTDPPGGRHPRPEVGQLVPGLGRVRPGCCALDLNCVLRAKWVMPNACTRRMGSR